MEKGHNFGMAGSEIVGVEEGWRLGGGGGVEAKKPVRDILN
jgi:hypothetical protein